MTVWMLACAPENIRYPAEDSGAACAGAEVREGNVALSEQAGVDAFCAGACSVTLTDALTISGSAITASPPSHAWSPRPS